MNANLFATLVGIAGALLLGIGVGYAWGLKRARPIKAPETPRAGDDDKARANEAELARLRKRVTELEAAEGTWKGRVAALEEAAKKEPPPAAPPPIEDKPRAPDSNGNEVRAELAALAAQYSALETERGELFNEVAAANKARAQAEGQIAALEGERATLKQQVAQLEAAQREALAAGGRARDEVARLAARVSELEARREAPQPVEAKRETPQPVEAKRETPPAVESAATAKAPEAESAVSAKKDKRASKSGAEGAKASKKK